MTARRAPSPKLTMAMKAPTPIARPSSVSTLRPGFRRSVSNAIPNSSLRARGIARPLPHDAPVADLDLSVGHLGHCRVVRDEDQRQVLLDMQLEQQGQDLLPGAGVQGSRGLVCQDQPWV